VGKFCCRLFVPEYLFAFFLGRCSLRLPYRRFPPYGAAFHASSGFLFRRNAAPLRMFCQSPPAPPLRSPPPQVFPFFIPAPFVLTPPGLDPPPFLSTRFEILFSNPILPGRFRNRAEDAHARPLISPLYSAFPFIHAPSSVSLQYRLTLGSRDLAKVVTIFSLFPHPPVCCIVSCPTFPN